MMRGVGRALHPISSSLHITSYFTRVQKESPLAVAGVEGLVLVFQHYVPKYYQWLVGQGVVKGSTGKSSLGPVGKFALWLKDKYQATVQLLLKGLHSPLLQVCVCVPCHCW